MRIDVYPIELDRPPEAVAAARAVLSHDERERAARYVFARDRDRFTIRRAAVRTLLARHLDRRPRELRFGTGSHGKPRLDGPHAPPDLCFNVSTSGDLALCAVTRGREIGVDLERLRPVADTLDLAARWFSAAEVAALRRAGDDLTGPFFACWTRKEAFVKALGTGLSHPLDSFSVSLDPGTGARVLHVAGDDAACWWLADLAPRPGFAGALAARGAPAEIAWCAAPQEADR